MQFCYELTDRQSARVIEQAIREEVTIRLDPHYSSGLEPFGVRLVAEEAEHLMFRILEDQGDAGQGLMPGQYCQAQFSLAESVYLLSVYVVELKQAEQLLRTGRPKLVQILERRRFIRSGVAAPTTLTLRWLTEDRQTTAPLFNVGGGGLAFRVPKDVSDAIAIGDVLQVSFELPGLPRQFDLKINICNKTVASDEQSVIIGSQFQDEPGDGQLGDLDELRRFLATQQQVAFAR